MQFVGDEKAFRSDAILLDAGCVISSRLVISDDGKPFDPLAKRDPDTTLSAAERDIGGLGILIVKKTMSPVTYRRRNGNNILTMGKDYGN